MTGRERLLTALRNEKPDHMPCQVHSWMAYYLNRYLGGMDQFQAYDFFGMDPVIYADPIIKYNERDFSNWEVKFQEYQDKGNGYHTLRRDITTPEGVLTQIDQKNEFTCWSTKHIIENERDFEIWQKYNPRPIGVDWTPIREAKKKIGDRGIVRGAFYDFGQGSPWQSFSSVLFGTENAIFACMDQPDWVHYVLDCLLQRKLELIDIVGTVEHDLVECGGGGGSSTVISLISIENFVCHMIRNKFRGSTRREPGWSTISAAD